MTRSLIAALALLPMLAAAQPYTEADITYSSPCGAPGVGKQWSPANGRARGEIHAREGQPGMRVDAGGWWAKGCTMPPAPRDCPERHVEPWRGAGGWRLCTPAKHAPLRAQNVGGEWSTHTAAGANPAGGQRWRCERQADGSAAWVLVRSHCAGR